MKRAWRFLNIDLSKSFKKLWITNALDNSKDYLVLDRIMWLVEEHVKTFQKELIAAPAAETMKDLHKLPPRKHVAAFEQLKFKQIDNGPAGSYIFKVANRKH